ncbi:MAG: LysM peptidoglycan-binding domain-containing protein [Pseudomonadales bacterium]|nr:LysM peptidoglycan-binding domain-containing protein [Pseudomonadales bacterium]NIX08696.1 LysM peptidoglycan-binding domain-containing protein [Pseudomonadales bacterium]
MRKLRIIFQVLIGLGLGISASAWSATDGLAQYLKPGHPEVYTVVKGDTLWDISGKFLDRPWLWPEIWRINPQIDNPHLIYPGDQIALEWVDGQPRLSLRRGEAARTYKMTPADSVSLQPQIRSTPLESAIPTIRLEAIQGFLVQNRVVNPSVLSSAPYVVQGENERLVLGAGDRLYVRGVLPDSESFNVVRKGPLYVDPETKEVLGQEATYIGLGKAVAQEGDIATMSLQSTREEAQIGDRVLPTEERRVDSTFFPSAPDGDVKGQIISVFGGVTQVGQYDVVVLNRGEREGIEVGNVMAIYKRGALARDRIANQTIRLPSERAGLLMVFRVFEKLSYGLVLDTERPLAVNDEVRNP